MWADKPGGTPQPVRERKKIMARPVTLFTGQWADLPLAELAPLAKSMGYDGLELACWGDHFDVQEALDAARTTCADKWALLKKHGLQCFAISNHLVGQAVCDLIDERHKAILPPHVWGDGDPEGVRQRAADARLQPTPRARRPQFGVKIVNGFTGSSIWHAIYAFPPTTAGVLGRGLRRLRQALDADPRRVRRRRRELRARGAPDRDRVRHRLGASARSRRSSGHPRFGFNFDPPPPRLPGRRLRQVHPHLRRPHLPRPHEGRVVGPRRRHGRRLRRPHQLRRRAPLLGLPPRRPRR